jgi:calcineurin-like phosphoesterase family protein
MPNTFFISDTHFGHENTCTKFKRDDGTPLRPFANAQEMDEEMVKRWNEVVKDGDKVYHLGDVVMSKKHITTMLRLKGSKRLILGNHDLLGVREYIKYFKEVYAIRVLEDVTLTHVPLHPESITQRWKTNVHGHTHANNMYRFNIDKNDIYSSGLIKELDPLYYNVSVEQIDYRPIEFSELRARIAARQQEYGTPDYGKYVHNAG